MSENKTNQNNTQEQELDMNHLMQIKRITRTRKRSI